MQKEEGLQIQDVRFNRYIVECKFALPVVGVEQ